MGRRPGAHTTTLKQPTIKLSAKFKSLLANFQQIIFPGMRKSSYAERRPKTEHRRPKKPQIHMAETIRNVHRAKTDPVADDAHRIGLLNRFVTAFSVYKSFPNDP